MVRRVLLATVVPLSLVLSAGCGQKPTSIAELPAGFRTRLVEGGAGIATVLPPKEGAPDALSSLPVYTPGTDDEFPVDLRTRDLSKLDVTSRLSDLRHADFDSRTRWPRKLPAGFRPRTIMETGKSPGLGLRALHRRGITGQGVGLAVIDGGLLVDHVEYRHQLRLYEEVHCSDQSANMHAAAVASIAVGKTVGVAPGADLYAIGETHMGEPRPGSSGGVRSRVDLRVTAQSIRRLLAVNHRLPKGRRIRVISISVGWMPGLTGYDDVMAAVEEAKREGVFVISVALMATHGLTFHGLGRDPMADPDKVASYTQSRDEYFPDQHQGRPTLFVPMDARTTASPTGAKDYVFYCEGAASWVVPYLAGLYALACQVHPDITPEEFWKRAIETGDTIEVVKQAVPDPEGALARRAAARTEAFIKDMKELATGATLEQVFGGQYASGEGVARDRMSEADYRAWDTERDLLRLRGDGKRHTLASIVNPARLIESLRR
jgi:hypothetical protein